MYTTYFGFREPPFNLTPSPHFFYTNSIYDGAFNTIEQGIREQRGMLLLTGEVGTGKTTLLRRLVHALDDDPSIQVVSLYYTMLAFEEFLSFLCEDLGLAVKMLDEQLISPKIITHKLPIDKFMDGLMLMKDEAGLKVLIKSE